MLDLLCSDQDANHFKEKDIQTKAGGLDEGGGAGIRVG